MSSRRLADILVVIGPSGCGKSTLIRRLQREFPREVGFSVSHTTRFPRVGEKDGVDYHFVDKKHFEALIESHAMIEHIWLGEGEGGMQRTRSPESPVRDNDEMPRRREDQKTAGNYYGTSVRAIEEVIAQNKVVLMDTDIMGAVKIRHYCEQWPNALDSPFTSTELLDCGNKNAPLLNPNPKMRATTMNGGGGSENKAVKRVLRARRCKVIFIEPPNMATLKDRLHARQSESEESLEFRLKLGSEWIRWADMNKELINYRLTNDDLERCYAEIKGILCKNCLSSL